MAKIVNLTPHAINLYDMNDCEEVTQGTFKTLVLKEGAVPKRCFPSEGVARVKQKKAIINHLAVDGLTVPVYGTTYSGLEGLPEPEKGTYYIVSAITAQAVKDQKDLLIVDGTVRDSEGRIVGCTAFGRV